MIWITCTERRQRVISRVCPYHARYASPTQPLPAHAPYYRPLDSVNAMAPGTLGAVTDAYDIDVVLKPPPSISLGGCSMVC